MTKDLTYEFYKTYNKYLDILDPDLECATMATLKWFFDQGAQAERDKNA